MSDRNEIIKIGPVPRPFSGLTGNEKVAIRREGSTHWNLVFPTGKRPAAIPQGQILYYQSVFAVTSGGSVAPTVENTEPLDFFSGTSAVGWDILPVTKLTIQGVTPNLLAVRTPAGGWPSLTDKNAWLAIIRAWATAQGAGVDTTNFFRTVSGEEHVLLSFYLVPYFGAGIFPSVTEYERACFSAYRLIENFLPWPTQQVPPAIREFPYCAVEDLVRRVAPVAPGDDGLTHFRGLIISRRITQTIAQNTGFPWDTTRGGGNFDELDYWGPGRDYVLNMNGTFNSAILAQQSDAWSVPVRTGLPELKGDEGEVPGSPTLVFGEDVAGVLDGGNISDLKSVFARLEDSNFTESLAEAGEREGLARSVTDIAQVTTLDARYRIPSHVEVNPRQCAFTSDGRAWNVTAVNDAPGTRRYKIITLTRTEPGLPGKPFVRTGGLST